VEIARDAWATSHFENCPVLSENLIGRGHSQPQVGDRPERRNGAGVPVGNVRSEILVCSPPRTRTAARCGCSVGVLGGRIVWGPRLRVDEGDRLKTVELDIVDELGARAAALENDLTLMKGGKFRTMTDADDGRVCELPRQQSHQTILAA
jgi:hypothetical protein